MISKANNPSFNNLSRDEVRVFFGGVEQKQMYSHRDVWTLPVSPKRSRSPGGRSLGGRSPGGRSPRRKSPGGRSPRKKSSDKRGRGEKRKAVRSLRFVEDASGTMDIGMIFDFGEDKNDQNINDNSMLSMMTGRTFFFIYFKF